MSSLLVLVTVIFIGVIFFLLYRIKNLLSVLTGSDKKNDSSYTNLNAILFPIFFVVGTALFFWATFGGMDYELPEASSIHGVKTDELFNTTMLIISAVFVLTNALIFIFPYLYKYKKGKIAKFYPDNHKLELIWTIIPAIVLTILVLQGNSVWWDIMNPPKDSKDNVTLEIVAERFQWNFRYPGADGELGKHNFRKIDGTNIFGMDFTDERSLDDFTTQEIFIPKGRAVLLKIRAKDVLHSVFMPHFRVKMDAVPGMPTSFWFTPTKTTYEMRKELGNEEFEYELACTEVCGSAHFNMRRVITVLESDEYDKWYAEQKPWVAGNTDYAVDHISDKQQLAKLKKVITPFKSKDELKKLNLPNEVPTEKVVSL